MAASTYHSCMICKKEVNRLKYHILKEHKDIPDLETYFLKYLSQTGVPPKCDRPACNKTPSFDVRGMRYNRFCSVKCSNKQTNFTIKRVSG